MSRKICGISVEKLGIAITITPGKRKDLLVATNQKLQNLRSMCLHVLAEFMWFKQTHMSSRVCESNSLQGVGTTSAASFGEGGEGCHKLGEDGCNELRQRDATSCVPRQFGSYDIF